MFYFRPSIILRMAGFEPKSVQCLCLWQEKMPPTSVSGEDIRYLQRMGLSLVPLPTPKNLGRIMGDCYVNENSFDAVLNPKQRTRMFHCLKFNLQHDIYELITLLLIMFLC